MSDGYRVYSLKIHLTKKNNVQLTFWFVIYNVYDIAIIQLAQKQQQTNCKKVTIHIDWAYWLQCRATPSSAIIPPSLMSLQCVHHPQSLSADTLRFLILHHWLRFIRRYINLYNPLLILEWIENMFEFIWLFPECGWEHLDRLAAAVAMHGMDRT